MNFSGTSPKTFFFKKAAISGTSPKTFFLKKSRYSGAAQKPHSEEAPPQKTCNSFLSTQAKPPHPKLIIFCGWLSHQIYSKEPKGEKSPQNY